jgi:hypothetical protein
MRKSNKENFIKKSINTHGEKYDYSKLIYKDNKTPVIIIFDNIEYTQRPDSHLQGKCPEKKWKTNKGQTNFLLDCQRVHGNKYDYSKSIYVRDNTKLIIICDKHGEFNQTPNSHLRGDGCSSCKESSGEREIRNFLINNNILFESQHTFSNCRNKLPLPFDFYLTDYNICIEYDGRQHYKINEFFGGEKTFEQLLINDNIKNEYCKEKNIKLLRIKFTEHNEIEKILFDFIKDCKLITQLDKNKKFIEKSINKWGYKYNYDLVNYVDARTPITITYKGVHFKQTPSKHLSGKLCELTENALSKEEFIRRCKLVWGNRFNYDETFYVNSYSKIKFFDTENDIFVYQKAHSHMNGHKYTLDHDNFIFLSNIIYDHKYDYTNFIMKNITDKVNIICREHGSFVTRAFDHINLRHGGMCPKCHFTKFNREVSKYLDTKGILYYKQYKFSECKNIFKLPLDFYIPSLRICIEFNDLLPNDTNIVNKLKTNDKIKNDYCEDNYIDLIRIRYDQIDRIFDILKESLKNKI